ncbi:MAG: biotin--[acetyl-CoA-carboxylase] ligase, partial [Zoogloea sp.]|nr:biotin--[acetyl-CoA-carboxylase] ligase [Zoogloea sp.]
MSRPADMLDPAAIAAALGAHSSRFAIDVLQVCDSTNARLLDAPLPDE